uniref:Cytochrome P450 n=1 Tax=Timema bartmani TaxID=61472 RepID=A0A7R9F4V3_9NEOP|nr:unnamed protein product [Timema bartmani]
MNENHVDGRTRGAALLSSLCVDSLSSAVAVAHQTVLLLLRDRHQSEYEAVNSVTARAYCPQQFVNGHPEILDYTWFHLRVYVNSQNARVLALRTENPHIYEMTKLGGGVLSLTFFTDGYETSANALIYTLYQLALNPHVQEKLRDEITAGLEHTEGEITYEAIQELKYLQMVCEESLRKYPPITYMNRICTKPYDLPTVSGGTYRVEVGMSVVIPTLALHHDPQYYPDPDSFNPDRFSEDNIQTRPKYVYFPFGGGPRICLGMRFGEALMKCGLVAILSSYDVMKMEKTPKALTHDPKAFFFAPNEEIWLDFKKRTS